MARSLHKFLILLVVITLVISCTPQADAEPLRAPTLAGSLQPWHSPTPSATPLPATPIPTQTPRPTATPHMYTVKAGDTMGSIAIEFGLDMGDLLDANPDVSPYAMSVGQEIIIPDLEAEGEQPVAMEVLDLQLDAPACYATLSDGTWCFVQVENNEQVAVESLAAKVSLFDEENTLIEEDIAYAFFDRLPAGESFPLAVYFSGVDDFHHAEASLQTGFAAPGDEGFVQASLQRVLTEIAWDGRSAQVSGEVVVGGDATQIWVLATAFDGRGNVVGARRWEGAGEENNFHLMVASLGHAIDHVSLLVEARP